MVGSMSGEQGERKKGLLLVVSAYKTNTGADYWIEQHGD
jgi:hypothetical protein